MHRLNERKIQYFSSAFRVVTVDNSFPWEEFNEVLYFIRGVKHGISISAVTSTGGQGWWALLEEANKMFFLD